MDAKSSWVHLPISIVFDWRLLIAVAALVRLLRKR
jgi:hypothetical protein